MTNEERQQLERDIETVEASMFADEFTYSPACYRLAAFASEKLAESEDDGDKIARLRRARHEYVEAASEAEDYILAHPEQMIPLDEAIRRHKALGVKLEDG